MNKRTKERGITIIALCVTLIVLCLIAGVSASVLTKNAGILVNSHLSKKKYIERISREQVDLACGTIRVAIAEAISKDGGYSAKDNSSLIQRTIINTLNNYISNLDGYFSSGNIDAENGQEEIKIEYKGNDYNDACGGSNSKVVYTIRLDKQAIEVVNEISVIIVDEDIKNENNNINVNYGNDVISKYIDREKQIIFISALIVIVTMIIILILLLVWMIDNDTDTDKNLSGINKIRYEARRKIKIVCEKIKLKKIRKKYLSDEEFLNIIQNKLIEMLNDKNIKSELNGVFEINKNVDNSSESVFGIIYIGDDYKKTCNDDCAVISYVISVEENGLNLVKENSTILSANENDDIRKLFM